MHVNSSLADFYIFKSKNSSLDRQPLPNFLIFFETCNIHKIPVIQDYRFSFRLNHNYLGVKNGLRLDFQGLNIAV